MKAVTVESPGSRPPNGAIAFLFTDIEGSTRLWEDQPQAMAMALRRHDDLVRAVTDEHRGHVFSTAGDGFAMAFSTMADALEAAVAIQQALHLGASDFEAPIKVRMGLHAGTAEERDGDYFGPVLNRGARIMEAGHGGQILVSALAAGLWQAPADTTIALRDLGTHRLKDLLRPERILQVTATGIPHEFPSLRSRRAGNIARTHPVAVGREREIHDAVEGLSSGRLVTVVTPIGRSAASICLGAAHSTLHQFPHGVWHVDLAPLAGWADLARALAVMLGAVGAPATNDDPLAEVAEALGAEPALLILEGGTLGGELTTAVGELLRRLPGASLLVASPEALGLEGERAVLVGERTLPPDLERFRAGPLFGRREELEQLRREVDKAAGGDRRLVMVSGEEGIGKSRLVAELAAEVVASDGIVLRGTWEEEGITHFQAFREAFSRHLEEVDRATLRARTRELLPVLDEFVPSGSTDRNVDRFGLLDALDAWLAELAAVQPVLLWLDDLQWADPSSLQMLQYLARSSRPAAIVIVVTYQAAEVRRTDDVSHAITQLRRSPGFEHVELSGLETAAAASLVKSIGRSELGPRSLLMFHEWSGGNPFFLGELARLVDEADDAEPSGPPRTLADLEEVGAPESLRQLVRWRLNRRSAELAEALTVAAVIGTVFETSTLATVLGSEVDEVHDLVDEAVLAGFLDDVPGSDTLFAFRKDLIRQALYQELRPHRRLQLHRRVLDVLFEEADPDPVEVTRHLTLVAGPDDLDRAVAFAQAAADQATDQMAFENAARHLDQALRMLDRYPELDGPRIELLIAAGKAHNKAGALGPGRDHLRRAADEARRRPRPDLMAEAALAWGGVLPLSPPMDPEAVAWLETVVEQFPDDCPERALALVRQAEWLHRSATYDERRALVDEGVAIAERLGDPGVLGWALNSAMSALQGPDQVDRAPAVAERLLSLSRAAHDEELAFHGWKLLLLDHFASGSPDQTRNLAATMRRLGEELRQPEYLRMAVMWDAAVANLEGRYDQARERVGEARVITLTGDHSQVSDIQLMLRVPEFGLQGTTPRLRASFEHAGVESAHCFRAWFHAEAGEADAAWALLQDPDLVDDVARRRWYLFWGEVVGFGTAATLLGHAELARRLRRLVEPYRGHHAVLGLAAFLGTVDHHYGVLSGALGEWDAAVEGLEAGLVRHEEMGARPWAALSRIELARVLEARGGPGDAARCATLTGAALAVADELDLGSVRTRVGRPIARA